MLEDSETDLIKRDHRAEVSTKKCGTEGKATVKEERDKVRWFLLGASSATSEVLLPTPTATVRPNWWITSNKRDRRQMMQRFQLTC